MKKNTLLASVTALALVAGVVQAADTLVISTGKSGGGYYGVGERLRAVMSEQGVASEVQASVGSTENLQRLDDPASPVNLGLTQADALKYYLGQHPKFADKLFTLGEIGKECVFIVTGKDSPIRSDADLQKPQGAQIAIRDPNSGAAITYLYMMQLEPGFKNTPAAFVETMPALLGLKTGGPQNKIKAVMFVQKPDVKSPDMQVVLDDPKSFHFVPVTDWDLNDKLPDGSAVYTFDKVTVQEQKWGFDTKVETICTRGLLIGNKEKLSPNLQERLAKVMLLSASRVLEAK